ncbi:protein BLISTER-like [Mangifera indica]|uniref:protein BLISTER-like n=1 Tax=Mangifera indica TaxID=29780 RepID=UPI001CF9861F|nr:protein BLISTER-like [Mangifera indica]
MASAQVLPTSRKQEHLEAGKRKLEEFRKKKAAERAKKTVSVYQPLASDVGQQENCHLEADNVRVTDSYGAGTSYGPDKATTRPSPVMNNKDNKAIEVAPQSQLGSLNDAHDNFSFSANDFKSSSADLAHTYSDNQKVKIDASSESAESTSVNNNPNFALRLQHQESLDHGSSFIKSNFVGKEEMQLKESESSLKISSAVNSIFSHDFATEMNPQNIVTTLGNGHTLQSSFEDSTQPTNSLRGSALEVGKTLQGDSLFSNPSIFDMGEKKISTSTSTLPIGHSVPFRTSESSSYSSNIRNFSDHVPMYSGTNEFTTKSRPSFLDSLNVARSSSGTLFQRTEPEKHSFWSNGSPLNNTDVLGSSVVQKPSMKIETSGPFSKSIVPNVSGAFDYLSNSSVSASNGADMSRLHSNGSSMEMRDGFYSSKQNEDFASLEQHIEDLTQEKFSLQRSLEASRALAESLASENSSLTDTYNQQRSVVNQLKFDMEQLQEEIKAQLVELESVKKEYANARLERNAADERANILASEVIGLEEKALRLRSSELKLERQLENSQSEISSHKRKMSSLEKERQDLQSTIDAFQEEKKLLQSKLRKASSSGKSIDLNKNSTSRKDISTSTEDLDTAVDHSKWEMHDAVSHTGTGMSSSLLLPENGQLELEVLAVNIPSDQMRMIQNINALISELVLEKEELMQALSSELSQSSKLKDLNEELSRKLEAQTQRLELLTAQSMTNANTSIRQPESHIVHDNTPYADEGDEVVERVLGWIMKLFPGGPSRRRTSKLL